MTGALLHPWPEAPRPGRRSVQLLMRDPLCQLWSVDDRTLHDCGPPLTRRMGGVFVLLVLLQLALELL